MSFFIHLGQQQTCFVKFSLVERPFWTKVSVFTRKLFTSFCSVLFWAAWRFSQILKIQRILQQFLFLERATRGCPTDVHAQCTARLCRFKARNPAVRGDLQKKLSRRIFALKIKSFYKVFLPIKGTLSPSQEQKGNLVFQLSEVVEISMIFGQSN